VPFAHTGREDLPARSYDVARQNPCDISRGFGFLRGRALRCCARSNGAPCKYGSAQKARRLAFVMFRDILRSAT